MSSFDPAKFMDQEVDSAGDTHYTPVPEDEYTAFIDEIGFREVNDTPVCDVTYLITDEGLKELMEMERVTVRQTLFLDVDDKGNLVFGKNKNIKLNRIREALGQNIDGQPWKFGMLRGAGPLMITIEQNPDKNDPETRYSNVVKVRAAA